MNKKRKIGTLLILIGIGIPLVLFSFQDSSGDLVLVDDKPELKYKEAVLHPENPDHARIIEYAKKFDKIDKPKAIRIGEDDQESTFTTDRKTGLIIMRWDYHYDYKGGFEIPYKYILALGIILTLIGAGMVIFSFYQVDLSTVWKRGKNYVIPWFLIVIFVSVLLFFLKPHTKINNIIQAIALVTLVFVTWVYAKQTQNLVAQEKESLDEEIKMRNANFGEKRLKYFYVPTFKELNELKNQLEEPVIDYELFSKTIRIYCDIYLDNIHMSPIDDKKKLGELNEAFLSIKEEVKKGKLEKETKDKILIKINEIYKLLEKRIFEIEIFIQKTYEFYAG